ncbi:hypothetical protein H696_05857 [Fonticula alba]|uniref:Uncharacterized protein n=1 Tax=Fonticula alba TaxID=691883 RepID=A0A058Z2I7_FONAL|nr:hypothetical protein H696_05857 [Fonticula alba]KCV67747.1 hypothetical protein H696_05857 [Fonticula alba]|eukprot:XP_009497931.1 hypothetical protein H696_05857 [Fonticula alba]
MLAASRSAPPSPTGPPSSTGPLAAPQQPAPSPSSRSPAPRPGCLPGGKRLPASVWLIQLPEVPLTPGELYCRDIEAGRKPLPKGFDSVNCLRLLLRLLGLQMQACTMMMLGRLMGFDQNTIQVLSREYILQGLAIPPPGRKTAPRAVRTVQFSEEALAEVEDLMTRDPPVPVKVIGYLLGLPHPILYRGIETMLPDLMPPVEDRGPCLWRLLMLASVRPPMHLRQMATLLSVSQRAIHRAVDISAFMPTLQIDKPSASQWRRLRELLAQEDPVLSLAEIADQTNINIRTLMSWGPYIDPSYAARAWGQLDQMHPLRSGSSPAGMALHRGTTGQTLRAFQIRWYRQLYLFAKPPGASNAGLKSHNRPRQLATITMGDYLDRCCPLPLEAMVSMAADEGADAAPRLGPGDDVHSESLARDDAQDGGGAAGAGVGPATAAAAAAAAATTTTATSDHGNWSSEDERLLCLLSLRPALSIFEISVQMSVPKHTLQERIRRLKIDEGLRSNAPYMRLTARGIADFRQLALEADPSKAGHTRRSVRDIARKLGRSPDEVFSALHRYCPEYFFLGLPPELASGPAGMYVPEEKLQPLLAAVANQYPVPVLHQVAVDLACSLPQVINSLRVHLPDMPLPQYSRTFLYRLPELEAFLSQGTWPSRRKMAAHFGISLYTLSHALQTIGYVPAQKSTV